MKNSPLFRKYGISDTTEAYIDRKLKKADRKMSKINSGNSDRKNERKFNKANESLDQASARLEKRSLQIQKKSSPKSYGDNMFTTPVTKSPLSMLGVSRSQSELAELEKKRDSVNRRIPKSLGGLHPSKKMGGAYGTADDDMDFKSRTDEQIAVLKPKKKSPLNNYENPKREYFSNREDFANLFKTIGDATVRAVQGDPNATDQEKGDRKTAKLQDKQTKLENRATKRKGKGKGTNRIDQKQKGINTKLYDIGTQQYDAKGGVDKAKTAEGRKALQDAMNTMKTGLPGK